MSMEKLNSFSSKDFLKQQHLHHTYTRPVEQ